jgi:hypothetical protein
MIEEPIRLHWIDFAPLVERVCRHGVGHPDPDSVAWLERQGFGRFGCVDCDGCCRPPVPWVRRPGGRSR